MIPDCPSDRTSRLTLALDHNQLPILDEWLRGFARRCGLSDESFFCLELVVTEAATNVMCYSGSAGNTGEMRLSCNLLNTHIEVEVVDDGLPFDPTTHMPAPLPKSLADAEPGGLGIHLMRKYTTSMHYRREAGRNILRMTLPAEPATSS